MPPRSLRARGLADLNPRILVGLPPRRRGGLLAALRAAVAFVRALVLARGLS